VIYAPFYAKILDWNFCLIDKNSQILVVIFVSKLNFSFSFCFVDENCQIFVVVVVFVTKINSFSPMKVFVFVVVDKKKHCYQHSPTAAGRVYLYLTINGFLDSAFPEYSCLAFSTPATLCHCFPFSQFPPLHFCAADSLLAVLTPAFWCRCFLSHCFMSRIFIVPLWVPFIALTLSVGQREVHSGLPSKKEGWFDRNQNW